MVYELGEPDFGGKLKPLYRLHKVLKADPATPIFFVEGEQKVDALERLGLLATTAGSCTSDDGTDFKPLAGRNVIFWPDNDKPGREHMQRVAAKLVAIGCTAETLDSEALGLPDGGDVVDYLREHPAATRTDVEVLARVQPALPDLGTEIRRLAALPKLEYEQQRSSAAKALRIRAGVLDAEVRRTRGEGGADPAFFKEVEPADEARALSDILDVAVEMFSRHVIAPTHSAVAVALWSAWTWVYEQFDTAPILLFKSPIKRCGKTTALSVVINMVRRPLPASSILPAALFRSIEKYSPTLILDEADTFLPENEELRGLINAGHTRATAIVIRCTGDDFEPTPFKVFGPKVLALIGRAPDTVEDRSVIVQLKRKLRGEKVSKLRDTSASEWAAQQANFARWALDDADKLRDPRPDLPKELNDRAADSWAPLLAIADLAGGEWPERARNAALALAGEAEQDIKSQLLADIRDILMRTGWDPILSKELVAELIADEDRPWATYSKGRPMSQSQLSRQLSTFGIVSRTVRLPNGVTGKGWPRAPFEEAFARYLGAPSVQSVTPTQTSIRAGCDGNESVTPENAVTLLKPSQANTGAGCVGVTVSSAQEGKVLVHGDEHDDPALDSVVI